MNPQDHIELLLDSQIYEKVILEELPRARKFIWIATADLKDMHFEQGGRFIPLLQLLAERIREGVEIRLIHAKEPGPRFREDFDRFPEFIQSDRFERMLCPRVHFKVMILDGKKCYMGSANFTGAGMGARNTDKRNFETGIFTANGPLIKQLMTYFDEIFLGNRCGSCKLRDVCPDPVIL